MSAALQKALAGRLGSAARFGEPLAGQTTWRVGGPAWCLAQVASAEDAVFVIASAAGEGMPTMALGRGSNLLVSDQGYRGVMIQLVGGLAHLRRRGEALLAGGGASLIAALKLAARQGLSGLEWAAGIPASVGGAVAANAGAMGSEMSQLTTRLELLTPKGTLQELAGADLPAAYRERDLGGSLLLVVELGLRPEDPLTVASKAKEMLDLRKERQPLAAATAGSVFKNPPGDFAGRLLEACGMKGRAQGAAVVSQRHANFIENRGGATAADIWTLIEEGRARVRDNFGVELETEVQVVGDV